MSMEMNTNLLAADLDMGLGEGDAEEPAVETARNLSFSLGDRFFLIPIAHVMEIVNLQPVTPVHDTPDYIRGIMNLRGHVVPLVDAALRLGLPAQEYDERTCIVVLMVAEQEVGVIVDRVQRVIDVPKDKEPSASTLGHQAYVRGVHTVDDRVMISVDPLWLAGLNN